MKYTGHLDLQRTWERTIRRAGLPLAYSEGFNPHPKIQFASALPLGFTSDCELVDIWLGESRPVDAVQRDLAGAAPPGIRIEAVEPIDLRAPSLQTRVDTAEYRVTLSNEPSADWIDRQVEALLRQTELPRQRRNKAYDLRPLILDLRREPTAGPPYILAMHLAAREGATGRPDEVLDALGLESGVATSIHRVRLHLVLAKPEKWTVGTFKSGLGFPPGGGS